MLTSILTSKNFKIMPNLTKKLFLALVVVIVVILALYFIGKKYTPPISEVVDLGETESDKLMVVVENTQLVNGVLPPPLGFPTDIPVEEPGILESATTDYPEQGAKQLSLSFTSAKTVAEKYAEYKSYLQRSGYKITETPVSSPVRALFGVKDVANLSVALSRKDGQTLVQLSYLLK